MVSRNRILSLRLGLAAITTFAMKPRLSFSCSTSSKCIVWTLRSVPNKTSLPTMDAVRLSSFNDSPFSHRDVSRSIKNSRNIATGSNKNSKEGPSIVFARNPIPAITARSRSALERIRRNFLPSVILMRLAIMIGFHSSGLNFPRRASESSNPVLLTPGVRSDSSGYTPFDHTILCGLIRWESLSF